MFAAPLLYLLGRNLADPVAAAEALADVDFAGPLVRSLVLAGAVAATATVVGTGLAWLTTRTDVPLRPLVRMLAPLPLVFPSFVGASALLAGFASGGLLDELLSPLGVTGLPSVEGFGGAWLVLTLFTYPYVYLPVAARFASLSPSLEESARLLGHRPGDVFRTVVLPQSSPAIWAGALLVFLYTVSDFGAVQLLKYDTLTRVIYERRTNDRVASLALSLLLGTLAMAVVAGERTMARRRSRIEVARARQALPVPLGRWRWPAFLAAAALLVNALLGPVAVLAWWVVRGFNGSGTRLDLPTEDLLMLSRNTAMVSVTAAVVTVAVILPVAYLTGRYRSRAGTVANAVVVGGFALPGLVVALALVSAAVRAPAGELVYQTIPLLVLGYVVHFGAQAMRASQVAVAAVPRRLDDAARMLGANRLRRFRSIELPLMRPGLTAGAGLVLLSTMKELPTTLLLAPPGFATLSTRIWNAAEGGQLAETGLTSLLLVALSGVLTWFFVIRRAERFD
ncbi:MAG: iron ABC transporter permease [Acidimicrobiales bacterium]